MLRNSNIPLIDEEIDDLNLNWSNIASEGEIVNKLDDSQVSEGAPSTLNVNCKGETVQLKKYKKVSVCFKDTLSSMPNFINLHETGLRRSVRLAAK